MRLHPAVFSLLFLLAASACQPSPSVARPGSRPLRVATWNVHDLFDAEDRTVPPGDLDEVPSPAVVEARLARLAGVLLRLDADVVLLQEVENLALARELATRAGYPEARLVEGFDPRGIDVAALSRLPVDRYVSHLGEVGPDGRPLWSRDCVELHLRTGGGALVLVGSHLVSRLTDPDGDRRTAQAARMREIADGLAGQEPGAVVLTGGDLNDEPWSAPLAPLLGDGAWIDPLATVGLGEATTWWSADGEARFDYLLLPSAEAWRLSGAAVVDGEDVATASDHRPVVLELAW